VASDDPRLCVTWPLVIMCLEGKRGRCVISSGRGASRRDIDRRFVWRCVFIPADPGPSEQPKFPPSRVSALYRPMTFYFFLLLFFLFSFFPLLLFLLQSDLISTWGGTMSGPACTQPLPRSLYQCPVIKMSPFNFRAIAFPLGGIPPPIKKCNRNALFTGNKKGIRRKRLAARDQ